jgi:hypothetical protein
MTRSPVKMGHYEPRQFRTLSPRSCPGDSELYYLGVAGAQSVQKHLRSKGLQMLKRTCNSLILRRGDLSNEESLGLDGRFRSDGKEMEGASFAIVVAASATLLELLAEGASV